MDSNHEFQNQNLTCCPITPFEYVPVCPNLSYHLLCAQFPLDGIKNVSYRWRDSNPRTLDPKSSPYSHLRNTYIFKLVLLEGFEPSIHKGQRILSPSCISISITIACTPFQIRTENLLILSQTPLPIGLMG